MGLVRCSLLYVYQAPIQLISYLIIITVADAEAGPKMLERHYSTACGCIADCLHTLSGSCVCNMIDIVPTPHDRNVHAPQRPVGRHGTPSARLLLQRAALTRKGDHFSSLGTIKHLCAEYLARETTPIALSKMCWSGHGQLAQLAMHIYFF